MIESLTERALIIAAQAHAGQMRKHSDVPYIEHPVMVAFKLHAYGFDETVIAAALVHDVLEDTVVTDAELCAVVGDEVMQIVRVVSFDPTLSWEERRIKYVDTLRTASVSAKAVSVADKIHNAESLLATATIQGPAVWALFNRGREQKLWFEELVLTMLRETWEHPLIDEYAQLIEQMKAIG